MPEETRFAAPGTGMKHVIYWEAFYMALRTNL